MIGHLREEPLEALYRRFGPAIYRRARLLLRDDQEAFDVTQDTFLAYMRTQTSLRGEASAFTVLYQIGTYKAVDRLRRNARWSGVLGSLELSDDDESPGAWVLSHEGGLSQVEALRDLALLTDGETPLALTAAILHFVEGHTKSEVGEILELDRKEVAHLLRGFAERARRRSSQFEKEAPP